tara:strand:- start:3274 stop:3942 length:669 start_codon:yes stop_codon:yes gene_type:complete
MLIITIDGPSGVGKGTLAFHLVERFKFNYLNSGSIYRSIAYIAEIKGIDLGDTQKLKSIGDSIVFQDNSKNNDVDIIFEDKIINDLIFNEETAKIASKISSNKELRVSLVSMQRSFVKKPGLIAEGRDMGSVIFPNADIKFFLTANNETKAKRRFKQLKEKGINVSLTHLIDELNARDKRDLTRKASPLIIPEDALVIETDNKTISDVEKEAIKHIKSKNNL